MKKCVVETINGFRVFGKVVNNNIPIELTSREILDVIRRTGVRCYELLGDQKIRLTMENYNIANILPGIVASEVETVNVDPTPEAGDAVDLVPDNTVTETPVTEETVDLVPEETLVEEVAETVEEPAAEEQITEETETNTADVAETVEEPAAEETKVEAPKNNFNSKFPTASKNNNRH